MVLQRSGVTCFLESRLTFTDIKTTLLIYYKWERKDVFLVLSWNGFETRHIHNIYMLYVFLLTVHKGYIRIMFYLILINKSVPLIHYVTICKQKTIIWLYRQAAPNINWNTAVFIFNVCRFLKPVSFTNWSFILSAISHVVIYNFLWIKRYLSPCLSLTAEYKTCQVA